MSNNFEINFDDLTPLQKRLQLQILAKRRARGECVCFVNEVDISKCGKKGCKYRNFCKFKNGNWMCYKDGTSGTPVKCCDRKKTFSKSWIKTHIPEPPPYPICNECEIRPNNCCVDPPNNCKS